MNGLIGELLIFLGLLFACQAISGGMVFIFMLFIILLAMVGAMTLLTMTRLIGITLGGEPRSLGSAQAHESSSAMLAAMIIPAVFCLSIGVFPQAVMTLTKGPMVILASGTPAVFTSITSILPFGWAWSTVSLAVLFLLAFILIGRYLARRGTGPVPTWGCGFIRPGSRLAYSAGSFSQYVQNGIYCSCLRPVLQRSTQRLLFPAAFHFWQRSLDPVLTRIFTPFFIKCSEFASACRRLQAGQLGIYLAYFFLTTVLLLGWAIFSNQG